MNSFRIASRAARASRAVKPAFTSVGQRAAISRSAFLRDPETVSEKHINVVSYKDGARAQETLPVSDKPNEPVSSTGQDVQAVATPLDPALIPQLTPTLAKFTLPGRIAVITGYVLSAPLTFTRPASG